MDLYDLGLTSELSQYIAENMPDGSLAGRVILEHRERYVVSTGTREFSASITGNMRFGSVSRAGYPAVGDWVTMMEYDEGMAVITAVLPRRTVLERQSVGADGEKQIIATNVDYAFILQSADNNLNVNRLERYLSICYTSDIIPVLIITKTDIADKKLVSDFTAELEARDRDLKYLLLSNSTGEGFGTLGEFLVRGRSCCVMGSSGVGKSTMINNLLKRQLLPTSEISHSTGKGRHTTSRRELFVLDNGGIIIDTPGMKELGMTDNADGIAGTFHEITVIARQCRYSDCTHTDEKGCAVIEAVQAGKIDIRSLENFKRMKREQDHFEMTVAEKRKKDRDFGKMAREILKGKYGRKG